FGEGRDLRVRLERQNLAGVARQFGRVEADRGADIERGRAALDEMAHEAELRFAAPEMLVLEEFEGKPRTRQGAPESIVEIHKAPNSSAAADALGSARYWGKRHMGPFDLSGRVAIVTGGNGGIGLGMAEGIAAAGATVVLAGRNATKGAAAVRQIKDK